MKPYKDDWGENIKRLVSYIGLISWVIYGLNETLEQDRNLNLYLSEKEIKKMKGNDN